VTGLGLGVFPFFSEPGAGLRGRLIRRGDRHGVSSEPRHRNPQYEGRGSGARRANLVAEKACEPLDAGPSTFESTRFRPIIAGAMPEGERLSRETDDRAGNRSGPLGLAQRLQAPARRKPPHAPPAFPGSSTKATGIEPVQSPAHRSSSQFVHKSPRTRVRQLVRKHMDALQAARRPPSRSVSGQK